MWPTCSESEAAVGRQAWGQSTETRLTTFSPNHVICSVDFAWSPRRLFTEHMLPRPESSPRDADGHESRASVGGELHMGGGVFPGTFSVLFSSHIRAINCQALVLARQSVKIRLPTRESGRRGNA